MNAGNQGTQVAPLIVYSVPLDNNQIPQATPNTYLGYKNVNFKIFTKSMRSSFVPYMYTDAA